MNKFILVVQGWLIYPENYTKEQLKENYNVADAAAYAALVAATAPEYWVDVEYWVNRYFELTGENRQDYIDVVHKENK